MSYSYINLNLRMTGRPPRLLVLFRDTTLPADNGEEQKNKKGKPDLRLEKELIRNKNLQKELAQAREDMRSVTEDQEAANEELQSANEELLSGRRTPKPE